MTASSYYWMLKSAVEHKVGIYLQDRVFPPQSAWGEKPFVLHLHIRKPQ